MAYPEIRFDFIMKLMNRLTLPLKVRVIIIISLTPVIFIVNSTCNSLSVSIGFLVALLVYLPLKVDNNLKNKRILFSLPVLLLIIGLWLITAFTYSGEVNWFGYHKKASIFEYFYQVVMFATNGLFLKFYLISYFILYVINKIRLGKSRKDTKELRKNTI